MESEEPFVDAMERRMEQLCVNYEAHGVARERARCVGLVRELRDEHQRNADELRRSMPPSEMARAERELALYKMLRVVTVLDALAAAMEAEPT